jgi:glycosyltransferase involved in cell wall biosynthesis
MNIRPLLILQAPSAFISGGYYRWYKLLEYGKSEDIDYVVVTDSLSYQNYIRMFPRFKEVSRDYKTYVIDLHEIRFFPSSVSRVLKVFKPYWDAFSLAISISKVARKENVDLIVGPSEGPQRVWTSYFSGKTSNKPWTSVFQGERFLFKPTPKLGPINPINVLAHVSHKEFARNISLSSKLGYAMELLGLLKIAEKSLMLTVGRSLSDELKFLNPKIEFHVIFPGNGIDLEKFNKKSKLTSLYDAVFFSRFVPEKGVFDLLEIWKIVTQKFSNAKLAVAGIIEDVKVLEDFKKLIHRYGLARNVVFLGQKDHDSIIDLVKSSKIAIYPSLLDVFSLTVLESLACGVPVVAYDIPAIKYNFHDCKAVLRSPAKNTARMARNVIFLLENEELINELSKEARKYASNFDWKKVVKAEKEAYLKVIEWSNSC